MKNSQSTSLLKKVFSYGDRLQPARDWFVLVVVAFVMFIFSIIWNIFLFTQFENGKTPSGSTLAPAQQDIGKSVLQIQALFQQRAAEQENYQHSYQFVDPSLPGS